MISFSAAHMFSDSAKSDRDSAGFTLIEVLIAVCVISVAFLALISVSVPIIRGNKVSRGATQATAMGQTVLEDLKNRIFYLGQDGVLGISVAGTTDDRGLDGSWSNSWNDVGNDLISARLRDPDCDPNASNVCTTADDTNILASTAAQLFAAPDWAANGNMNPVVVLTRTPQVVWSVRDNAPLEGVKRILVIVGWQEADGVDRYVVMSTFVAGWRHENAPYTK